MYRTVRPISPQLQYKYSRIPWSPRKSCRTDTAITDAKTVYGKELKEAPLADINDCWPGKDESPTCGCPFKNCMCPLTIHSHDLDSQKVRLPRSPGGIYESSNRFQARSVGHSHWDYMQDQWPPTLNAMMKSRKHNGMLLVKSKGSKEPSKNSTKKQMVMTIPCIYLHTFLS